MMYEIATASVATKGNPGELYEDSLKTSPNIGDQFP